MLASFVKMSLVRVCHPNTIGYHKQMIVPLSGQANESETPPPMDTNNNILGADLRRHSIYRKALYYGTSFFPHCNGCHNISQMKVQTWE